MRAANPVTAMSHLLAILKNRHHPRLGQKADMGVWKAFPNCSHSRCCHNCISDPVCRPNEEILNIFFLYGVHLIKKYEDPCSIRLFFLARPDTVLFSNVDESRTIDPDNDGYNFLSFYYIPAC